jgi:hypothetical protein
MWDFKSLIYDAMHTKSIQEYINHRFNSKDRILIDLKHYAYVVMKNGDKFHVTKDACILGNIYEIYKFDDIRKNDIVVDIGANIGGFVVPASRLSDHVYAVEPIMVKELKDNIVLNGRDIQIIDGALGDGGTTDIEWEGSRIPIKTMTLAEIKQRCGGCDFLVCNCEGGEWAIKPEELAGIRRIEMMVHLRHRSVNDMVDMLSKLGFVSSYYCGGKNIKGFDKFWMVSARRDKCE